MRPRNPTPVTEVSVRASNRPDMKMNISNGVMFSAEGSTGWGRIRNLGDYKGNKSEKDFHHLHEKFTEEEEE